MGLCYSRFLNIEQEEEAEYELDHEKLSLRRASTIKLELRKYVSYTQDKVSDIYEIKEVIGEGAYGCVRRVIHKMTGMERAMKSILKSYAGAEGLNVIQEADILKELDHPNIVKIYDIIEDARLYHLIMELNTGSELFDKVVKNHALSEKEVAQYMYYIFSGVSYCHQNHVIHRDLKPENVMFQDNSPDSPLKIIDFGISIMQPFSKKKPNFYGRVILN